MLEKRFRKDFIGAETGTLLVLFSGSSAEFRDQISQEFHTTDVSQTDWKTVPLTPEAPPETKECLQMSTQFRCPLKMPALVAKFVRPRFTSMSELTNVFVKEDNKFEMMRCASLLGIPMSSHYKFESHWVVEGSKVEVKIAVRFTGSPIIRSYIEKIMLTECMIAMEKLFGLVEMFLVSHNEAEKHAVVINNRDANYIVNASGFLKAIRLREMMRLERNSILQGSPKVRARQAHSTATPPLETRDRLPLHVGCGDGKIKWHIPLAITFSSVLQFLLLASAEWAACDLEHLPHLVFVIFAILGVILVLVCRRNTAEGSLGFWVCFVSLLSCISVALAVVTDVYPVFFYLRYLLSGSAVTRTPSTCILCALFVVLLLAKLANFVSQMCKQASGSIK